jgi:hypothetical protein
LHRKSPCTIHHLSENEAADLNDDELRALARSHTPETLKVLASIAVDPNAIAGDREKARKALANRLEQLGDQLSPDLRRELENAVHGK